MPRLTVEQVRILHQEHPDNEHYIAVIEGTLPSYHLWKFSFNRHCFSDELPLEDVSAITEIFQGKRKVVYKCQTAFSASVQQSLMLLIEDDVVTAPELTTEINAFMALEEDLEFHRGDPRNPEKLTRVNRILDKVIACLAPMVSEDRRPQLSSWQLDKSSFLIPKQRPQPSSLHK